VKGQKSKHGPEWKVPHKFHLSKTFMDYLHGGDGDVKPDTFAACFYEYTRESQKVWQAAKCRDELIKKGEYPITAALHALNDVYQADFFLPPIRDFLCCISFPKKDWNELSNNERQQIMHFLPTSEVRPLPMDDVLSLQDLRILGRFKSLAEKNRPEIKEVPPGQMPEPMKFVEPMLQQYGAVYHAIFALDFSKSEKRLMEEFRAWLRTPEHAALLKKYRRPKTGKTGTPLDRLKDLAAWRLYRECDNDWQTANDFADKHRKQRKHFRDAKKSGADLFGEQADAYKAKAAALKYLADLMPNEFRQADHSQVFAKLEKIAKDI